MRNAAWSVTAVVALIALSASAQPKDPREQARALGEQGVALLNEGKYADALDALQRADALYHAPTLTFYMGECNKYLGHLVEARAAYEKVVADPLPANASGPIRASHDKAKAELAGLAKRIPWVAVELVPDERSTATITLDGNKVSAEKLGHLEMNPGAHHLEAARPSGGVARADVTLKEGENRSVRLELPSTSAGPPPVAVEPAVEPDAGPAPHPLRKPGFVVAGVGGVGIVIGAITGMVSIAKTNDLKSKCPAAPHCSVALKDDYDSAQSLATVSDIGFIAGGVLAGAGVVMILYPGKRASDSPPPAAALRLSPGPGSLLISGSF